MRPLAESLELVAREVSDLAQAADQLQALVLRLAAGGATDPVVLIEAQAVDLFSQRLDGLAAFVRALADAAPNDVSADVGDAVRALTLAEQARRLSGAAPAPAPDPGGEPATFWD
jgi:hypothetical protein